MTPFWLSVVQAPAAAVPAGEFVVTGLLAGVIVSLTQVIIHFSGRKNGHNGKAEGRVLDALERAAKVTEQVAVALRDSEKELSAIRRDMATSVAGQAALHGMITDLRRQHQDDMRDIMESLRKRRA